MKTNVNIVRKLDKFNVVQRTKDGMFNATSLLKQWNENLNTHKNGDLKRKDLDNFLNNKGTKSFIDALADEEELNKQYSAYSTTRGKNGGTWMHPYLFVKFAMWLNPRFEVKVIKFVYDELIKHRHLSGDNYNRLCSALARFQDTDYREVGRILNFIVFNTHERELRNQATPDQQSDLHQVERDLSNYIENGFINTYKQFKEVARREWRKRHAQEPSIFTHGQVHHSDRGRLQSLRQA